MEITSSAVFRYQPGDWLLRRYRRRGPVSRIGAGRSGYTYLLGPEANQFAFAHSELFSWRQALDFLAPVDGETSMLLSDGDDHRRRRRLVEPSLRPRPVASYLPAMAANADAVIDRWQPGTTINAYLDFRAAIRRATLESLFGPRLTAEADVLGQDLQLMLDLCGGLPQLVQVKGTLRVPQWRRAMEARSRVDAQVFQEIRRLRSHGPEQEPGTVLEALVHGRDPAGNALSDTEIRDQSVTLIVAGYETTSAAMAWALHGMLTTPGVWSRAAAEVRGLPDDRAPTKEDLADLPYLRGVVSETLRVYSPAVVLARWAREDFEFAGQRVRAGSTVVISPYVTHRLAKIWPDPLTFRPQRWIPGSDDWSKPKPWEYLPFGGGAHRCIGAAMATTELTVMLARVLTRTELRLEPQRIRPTSMVTMRPRGGLLVRLAAPPRRTQ